MSILKDVLLKRWKEARGTQSTKTKEAAKWFAKQVRKLDGKDIMAGDTKRLRTKSQLGPRNIGRIILFYYDAKLKNDEKALPYWDRFPCIVYLGPSKEKKNLFLGLNLHYVTPAMRAKFLDGLYSIYLDTFLDERKKLQLTYQMCKANSRLRFYKPMIKAYDYAHIRSKYYVVDPTEWDTVVALPLEQFERQNKTYVWTQSRKIIQGKK